MIARNYRKFPDALIAQSELELVFAVGEVVSEVDLAVMRASFAAAGAWIRQYAAAVAAVAANIPAWWAAMRQRAKALSRAVKAAISSLF